MFIMCYFELLSPEEGNCEFGRHAAEKGNVAPADKAVFCVVAMREILLSLKGLAFQNCSGMFYVIRELRRPNKAFAVCTLSKGSLLFYPNTLLTPMFHENMFTAYFIHLIGIKITMYD